MRKLNEEYKQCEAILTDKGFVYAGTIEDEFGSLTELYHIYRNFNDNSYALIVQNWSIEAAVWDTVVVPSDLMSE